MSTRSTIAIERTDGTVHQVYCHWDGYVSNNGRLLLENYSDPSVLQELIDLGSISSLGDTIGFKHSLDDYSVKMTTFYARDCGEDLKVNKFIDYADYCFRMQVEEFNYILRNTGIWEFTILDVGVVRSLEESWANEQLFFS
jgi:hypothetical protein